MERDTLRISLRKQRRSLSDNEQSRSALGALQVIKTLPIFSNSQHIALYIANDGELDPEKIIKHAWQLGKSCYLPVLDPNNPKIMYFQQYTNKTRLIPNRFHIPEPEFKLSQCIRPEELDLVFMPLTGFDICGGRLGMGGGFYDRTFAFVTPDSKPALLGLAHECQKVDRVPVEEWDVAMAGVVTGERFY